MAKVKGRARKKTPKELASASERRRAKAKLDELRSVDAVCKRLSKSTSTLVSNIANEEWVHDMDPTADEAAFRREAKKWERVRNRFLRESTNPIELHAFAVNWNFDQGSKPIHRVITHSHCDAGTALYLYWINDPYFYQEYRNVSDAPEDEWLRSSRTIERRFRRNDFRTCKIRFDPQPWVTDRYAHAEWVAHNIPDIMYQPVSDPKRKNHT